MENTPNDSAENNTQSLQSKITLSLIFLIIYCLLFLILYDLISKASIALAILPIIFIANLFGWKIGFLTGLLFIPLNIVLLLVSGEKSLSFEDRNFWLSQLVFIVIGIAVGYLHDLRTALKSELSERQKIERQLIYAATHDNLTGLVNQSFLNESLRSSIERNQRIGKIVAILFLDINDFKEINASLGHQEGDQVLITVAERLANCIRGYDTLARLGGDDFVILLDDLPHPQIATTICDRILTAISKPFTVEGEKIELSINIGISLHPYDGESVNELIKNSETAMYKAKRKGANIIRFFS